jgi:hypothetical protein
LGILKCKKNKNPGILRFKDNKHLGILILRTIK